MKKVIFRDVNNRQYVQLIQMSFKNWLTFFMEKLMSTVQAKVLACGRGIKEVRERIPWIPLAIGKIAQGVRDNFLPIMLRKAHKYRIEMPTQPTMYCSKSGWGKKTMHLVKCCSSKRMSYCICNRFYRYTAYRNGLDVRLWVRAK